MVDDRPGKQQTVMRKLSGITLIAGVLTCAGALAAEPLGRLFFTPAQRNALDAGKTVGEPRTARTPVQASGPRELRLDGVVTRSDGESTVWVNGQASDLAPPPRIGVAIKSDPAAARIKVQGKPGTRTIRVGQSLDTRTGDVREGYAQDLGEGTASEGFAETQPPDSNVSGQSPTAARRNGEVSVSSPAGQK